jgi:hypothetical protein
MPLSTSAVVLTAVADAGSSGADGVIHIASVDPAREIVNALISPAKNISSEATNSSIPSTLLGTFSWDRAWE